MSRTIVSCYDPQTGIFTGERFSGSNAQHVLQMVPAGRAAIVGEHDHLARQVNLTTGEVEDHQPAQPSPGHEWNTDRKRWQLSEAAQAKAAATAAARARHAELVDCQHTHIRRLALNPFSITARLALRRIEREVRALQALLG
jgi:hypothetical protein